MSRNQLIERFSLVPLIAMLVACSFDGVTLFAPATLTPIATPRTATPSLANVSATETRANITRTPIAATGPITLTLWTTEDLAPGVSPAGRVLRGQLDTFTAANPNIRVEVLSKKAYGKGGLLDFLIATNAVVPTQLPDLAVLDISEAPLAAEQGVLQPLDGLLPAELKNDLFPFALKTAQVKNQWLLIPFTADVEHLVYNKATIKKTPATWDEFLKQKSTLLVPLAGDDAFLLQYASLASMNDPAGSFALDPNSAAQVLNFFKRAHEANVIPETAINSKTVDEAWSPFTAGQVSMIQASASRYLIEREKYPNAQYAFIPTRDGKMTSLATGWGFAMTTRDPVRQNAAARLIQWIVQSDRLAAWLRAGHRLPANRATLALAVEPAEYAAFLRDVLERAMHMPALPDNKQREAWRTAITTVWKGQMTPEEAARNATTTAK